MRISLSSLRFAPGFLLLLSLVGCAVNAIRDGYTSPVQAKPAAAGPALSLSGMEINASGIEVTDSDKAVLRNSLAQFLASTGRFSSVALDGKSQANNLHAVLNIKFDRIFNWWPALPSVFPASGYWSLQPYVVKSDLTLNAKGLLGGIPFDFSTWRTIRHNQELYEFFTRQAVEDLLSQAYDQMFTELRNKIAEGDAGTTRRGLAAVVTDTSPQPHGRIIRNIAVLQLEPNGVDSSLTKVVSDQLIDDFIAQGRYNVLERQRINQILDEQGFQQSGACDNQNCLVQVGKLLGVDAMVSGSVSQIKNMTIVSVRIFDVGTGMIVFATQVRTEEGISHLLSVDLKSVAERF